MTRSLISLVNNNHVADNLEEIIILVYVNKSTQKYCHADHVSFI